MTAKVEIVGVSKTYPGVRALDAVDFDVVGGEVHALMGENGAGKSTLIKVMTGAVRADAGELRLDGRVIKPDSPGAARAAGIAAVYQEVNLVPTMSVTRNLMLGRLPRRFGLVDWPRARRIARALDLARRPWILTAGASQGRRPGPGPARHCTGR